MQDLRANKRLPTITPVKFAVPRGSANFLCSQATGVLNLKIFLPAVIVMILLFACIFAHAETASYYTYESCRREGTSGVWTASGERFNENDFTCAMRRRDFGKYYKVTNLANGKSVIVRHNDFGPNKKLHDQGRVVDLSKAAFQAISSLKLGVINIKVEEVER